MYWLAMPFFAPIPWEAERFYSQKGLSEKNITLDWYPVGTGPYMLTENDPNRVMMLERNPNFHGETYPSEGMPDDAEAGLLEDAGKPLPFIDKVIFSREKESIPRWNKFLQGYYDASSIGSDSFDQAVQLTGQGEATVTEAMKQQGIRLETSVAASTNYMGFNMLDPVVGGVGKQSGSPQENCGRRFQLRSITKSMFRYLPTAVAFLRKDRSRRAFPAIAKARKASIRWCTIGSTDVPRRKPIEAAKKLLAEAGYPEWHGCQDRRAAGAVLRRYRARRRG